MYAWVSDLEFNSAGWVLRKDRVEINLSNSPANTNFSVLMFALGPWG